MNKDSFIILLVITIIANAFAFSLHLSAEIYFLSILLISTILGIFIINSKNNSKSKTTHSSKTNELDIARRVQQALINYENPNLKNIKISKQCIPAASIGGDFYTFIDKVNHTPVQKADIPGVIKYTSEQENYLGIAVGDVAGHGISSALVMALSAGLIDKIASQQYSAAEVLNRSNEDIRKFISNSKVSHLTLFFGFLNTDSLQFTYAKAGHHPGIVIHKDKTIDMLEVEGIVLGMFEDEEYTEKKYQLSNGDRLVLYTDGIIEASNTKNEVYGIDRLITILQSNNHLGIEELKEKIFKDTETFSKGHLSKDDQTLLIIEV